MTLSTELRSCVKERGGRPGLPVPNGPYGVCGRKPTLNELSPRCEPVWPSGKAFGWQAEGPRLDSVSAILSLQKL